MDRKFVYSHMKPVRTFRTPSDDFSCCSLAPFKPYLFMGTDTGHLKIYNVNTAKEEASYKCYDLGIFDVELHSTGDLLLTSGRNINHRSGPPSRLSRFMDLIESSTTSCLWRVGDDVLDEKFSFEEGDVEFSKAVQDKIVGSEHVTSVYDVATGTKLLTLDPSSVRACATRATFSPSDKMISSHGILWDASSGKFGINGLSSCIGLSFIFNQICRFTL